MGDDVDVALDAKRVYAGSRERAEAYLAGDEWRTVAEGLDVRAIDGTLLAAGRAYRLPAAPDDDGLAPLAVDSIDDPRDVAAAGPYVAATEGLYRIDPSSTDSADHPADPVRVRDGPHEVVAAGGGRAHAVSDERLYERRPATGAGERDEVWTACDVPAEERVVDVAYGESVYAVTRAGTVPVDADPEQTPDGHGGCRSRALGVAGTRAIAVP